MYQPISGWRLRTRKTSPFLTTASGKWRPRCDRYQPPSILPLLSVRPPTHLCNLTYPLTTFSLCPTGPQMVVRPRRCAPSPSEPHRPGALQYEPRLGRAIPRWRALHPGAQALPRRLHGCDSVSKLTDPSGHCSVRYSACVVKTGPSRGPYEGRGVMLRSSWQPPLLPTRIFPSGRL